MKIGKPDSLVRRRRAVAVISAVLGSLSLLSVAAGPASAATGDHFTCSGSGLRVTALGALNIEPAIANSANDPCTTTGASVATVAVPSVLGAGVASASTTSAAASGSSTGKFVSSSVPLLGLSADLATASAAYGCAGTNPMPQTSSQVVNLRIGGGAPITTSGQVSLPLVGLIDIELNKTTTTATSVTRRAVDITVLSGVDQGARIVLGEASAGISGNPCSTGGGTGGGLPVDITPPVITGTAKAGATFTCTTGNWTNNVTSFTYSWSRQGTPIAGATNRTYVIRSSDEGLTLTCTVTAITATGAKASATSKGRRVAVPHVARCPRATGRLKRNTLGLVHLGMTRTQARRAFTHSSTRGRRYEDFFCLTPIGVRVGYASPALLKAVAKNKRNQLRGRVVWASTSSAWYSIQGIRPGATLAAAQKKFRTGAPFHLGVNYWYLARSGASTAVLKVRHGIVEEIGIGNRQITRNRKAQRSFMSSFS